MPFLDDLNKAVGMFNQAVDSYQTTELFNSASKKIEEINNSAMKELDKRAAVNQISQQLAQGMLQSNAPVSRIQAALQAFGSPALPSAEQQIQEGVMFNEDQRVKQGQEIQAKTGEVDFLRRQALMRSSQKPVEPKKQPIKGFIADPNVEITSKDVEAVKKSTGLFKTMMPMINALSNQFKEEGFATFGKERGRAEALSRFIQLNEKEILNLGVLNGPDLRLLQEMIPEISQGPLRRLVPEPGLKTEIKEKFRLLQNKLVNNLQSVASSRGLEVDPQSDIYKMMQQSASYNLPDELSSKAASYLSKARDLNPKAEKALDTIFKNPSIIRTNPEAAKFVQGLDQELYNQLLNLSKGGATGGF